VGIELHYSVTLGVLHRISKDSRALVGRIGVAKQRHKFMPVKDVVAENQSAGLLLQERLCDKKRLRQSFRFWLNRILESKPPLRTTSEELLEAGGVLGSGDYEKFANARQH
jgi:hypothetical protein